MHVYLITHGERHKGSDPVHTRKGLAQIRALPLPKDVSLIVSGTGKRFLEVLGIVRKKLPSVPVKYSIFCGGPEGFEGNDQVVLTDDRRVDFHEEYVGISNGPLNMWEFIQSLPDNALLCAGTGLILGLGLKEIYQGGHLFKLEVLLRNGKMIA